MHIGIFVFLMILGIVTIGTFSRTLVGSILTFNWSKKTVCNLIGQLCVLAGILLLLLA